MHLMHEQLKLLFYRLRGMIFYFTAGIKLELNLSLYRIHIHIYKVKIWHQTRMPVSHPPGVSVYFLFK